MRKLYSVFDSKAKAWGAPMMMGAHGEAIRNFSDAVKDDKTMLNKHPNDFQLFFIGEYDEQTGALIPNPPMALAVASEFFTLSNGGEDLPFPQTPNREQRAKEAAPQMRNGS